MWSDSKGENDKGEKKTKMRFGFKKLVRAISPLIRGGGNSQTNNQHDDEDEQGDDTNNYHWDLSNTDLKAALRSFYRQYNPEKSFIVGEIVQKYEGDEILLLQELCKRYHLSENDMQQFLDQAPSKEQLFDEKFRESSARRPSASIFNKSKDNNDTASRSSSADRKRSPRIGSSDNKTKGRDRDEVESVRSSGEISRSEQKRRPSKAVTSNNQYNHHHDLSEEKDDQSLLSSPTATAASNGPTTYKFQNYYWDITDVDIGKALKLLYKQYNPKKSPNTAILEHKNQKEILHLLRQLCKRHCLTESEMESFLEKARKRPTITNQEQAPHAEDEDEDLLALDVDDPSQFKPKLIQDSAATASSSSNMMTGRVLNANNPPPPPPPVSRDSFADYMRENSSVSKLGSLTQKGNAPNQNSLMSYYSAPAVNENSFQSEGGNDFDQGFDNQSRTTLSSITPPQPPPPSSRPTSLPAKTHAPFSQASAGGSIIIHDDDHSASTNRFSVDYLKPVLPDGSRLSYGPVIRELKGENDDEEQVSLTPSQIRAMEKDKEKGKDKMLLLAKNPSNDSTQKQFSITPDISSTAQVHKLSDPPQPATNTANTATNAAINNPEITLFRQELIKAQEQIAEMTKENAFVISLLKQGNFNVLNNNNNNNNNNNSSNNSVTSNLFNGTNPTAPVPTEHKGIQAEDLTLKTELSKSRSKIAQLEATIRSIEKAYEIQLKENDDMKEEIEEYKTIKQDLLADKGDLLQLLNILATAPVPAKNVLESYLNKLSTTLPITGNTTLREKVFENKGNLPIGDRIHYLLHWKRNQEKLTQSANKNKSKKEKKQKDDERAGAGGGEGEDKEAAENNNDKETREDESQPTPTSPTPDRGVSISSNEYQTFGGKDLLLSLSKKDKLLLGDVTEQDDDQPKASTIDPKERKLYERINVAGLNPPEKKTTSAPSSRSTTPNTSTKRPTSSNSSKTNNNNQNNVDNNASLSASSPYPADPFAMPVSAASVASNTSTVDKQKHDLLNEQYDLAKRYYQHQQSQAKLSEQLNSSNLLYQELETTRAMKEAISSVSRNTSPQRLPSSNNSNNNASNNNTTAAANNNASSNGVNKKEWIECFDPKSQRKYYYNTALKKSTWKNPFTNNPSDNSSRSASPGAANNRTSRDPSPQMSSTYDDSNQDDQQMSEDDDEMGRMTAVRNRVINNNGNNINNDRLFDRQGYPINNGRGDANRSTSPTSRNTSPFLKSYMTNTQSYSASVTGSTENSSTKRSVSSGSARSSNQESQRRPEDVWVTAIDPKSQRRYWYNR